jgi:peptidoglycan hydrolase-like protein with peptidoglycan-binding domain
MPTSQNNYPASPDRNAIGVKTFQVPGRGDVFLPVRADVAPLFLEMARWWDTWETLMVPGCWGYAYRTIRGQTTGLSNHASGTAIDLNAPRHGLGAIGTLGVHRSAVIEKARSLGLRSGAEYTGRKDEMHVELNVPLDQALDLVRRLQAPSSSTPPAGGRSTLQRGSTGDPVKLVQRWLGLTQDGIFGLITEAKVRWYQKMKGLQVDGVVGPQTWRAMGL